MALYWPDKKVALDIVDDPHRNPFEGDDSYTVLRVTCAELSDYESFDKFQHKLCKLLGTEYPTGKDWKRRNRALFEMMRATYMQDEEAMAEPGFDDIDPSFDLSDLLDFDPFERPDDSWLFGGLGIPAASFRHRPQFDDDKGDDFNERYEDIEILAPTQEIADIMSRRAGAEGHNVKGTVLWDGPIPDGSFEDLSPSMRMSTAEFFFLRSANELPFAMAVMLGNELCGRYRTSLTSHNLTEGYRYFAYPRTLRSKIRKYLRGARRTREGKRAKRVLRLISDACCSPAANYVFTRLCLPTSQGGYGIPRAEFGVALDTGDSIAPSHKGPFLAYDICWSDKHVAVQYTGSREPSERALKALGALGMRVVCVNDVQLANADEFDKVARKVAKLLNVEVPKPDDSKWTRARDELCHTLPVPTYDRMRLTVDDIAEHAE